VDNRPSRSARRAVSFDAYDQTVTGPQQVAAATAALKAMLGDDVLAVPEFTPPQQVANDWHSAIGDSGKLVAHLQADPFDSPYPVDDWLHGVARVREMPRLWEKAVMLGDALFGGGGLLGIGAWSEPALTPIQFPYQQSDSWRAMDFKPGAPPIGANTLMFTVSYASQPLLGGGATRCGLVFDEWTEVLSADQETTGIAMQVDRPESEPPQSMLLAVPPVRTGAWNPDDLLTTVIDTFELARLRGRARPPRRHPVRPVAAHDRDVRDPGTDHHQHRPRPGEPALEGHP
jgi:hypothetical protein